MELDALKMCVFMGKTAWGITEPSFFTPIRLIEVPMYKVHITTPMYYHDPFRAAFKGTALVTRCCSP